MKKILAFVLAAVMVFALCACGQSAAPAAAAAAAPADGAAPAAAPAAAGAGIPASELKIGFITLHDENSPYDRNFIDAAKEVFAEFGLADANCMFRANVGEDETCYDAAAELADAGCDLIFSDSYGHEPYMIQAASEFPEVQFVSATADRAHTEGLANFHNTFADIYMGRFLAGVAAGMKLNEMIEAGKFTADEAKIGYVGAKPYAEVISGYTSFYLGVRYICPSVTMDVIYTNSWYDETLEKEAANQLINNGCKLISEHADSMGAPTACETAGVPNVSYNVCFLDATPKTYLAGSRINWRIFFREMVQHMIDGTEIPTDYCGTLAAGAVETLDINEAYAAEGTAEKMDELRAKLLDGSLKVFDTSTFTVTIDDEGGNMFNNNSGVTTVDSNGVLTNYLADVINDGTFTGETDVVSDGYFHESELRSAPYFYCIIDGINIIA